MISSGYRASAKDRSSLLAAVALLLLSSCSSTYGDLEKSQALSDCLNVYGSANVYANTSWQFINAQNLKTEQVRTCIIDIVIPSLAPGPTQLTLQRPLLLLRLDSVQLDLPERTCDASASSLRLYVGRPDKELDYICSTSTVTYVWASENLKIYNMLQPRSVAGSFAIAFKVTEATNMCQGNTNNSDLVVDSVTYVFAPDERYAKIPPNSDRCREGINYTLNMKPADMSKALAIKLLTAPWSDSCRILCANDMCFNKDATYSAGAGEQVSVRYSSRYCNGRVLDWKRFSGFTLEVELENQHLPYAIALVAGVSAAAALAFLMALAVLAVVIHRKLNSSSRASGRHRLPMTGYRMPMSDLAICCACPPDSSRQPSAPTQTCNDVLICTANNASVVSDVGMVENDLYVTVH